MAFMLKITLLRNFGMPLWDFGAKVHFFYFSNLILLPQGGSQDQKIRKIFRIYLTFNGRPTDHIWQAGPLCVQKKYFFFRQTHC